MQKMALSISEAVEITGLCRDTIYRAIGSGALVARKNGKRTLILRSELESFLTSLPVAQMGK